MTVHGEVSKFMDGAAGKAKMIKYQNTTRTYSEQKGTDISFEDPTKMLVDATSILTQASYADEMIEREENDILSFVDGHWRSLDYFLRANKAIETVVYCFDTGRPHNKLPKQHSGSRPEIKPYDGREFQLTNEGKLISRQEDESELDIVVAPRVLKSRNSILTELVLLFMSRRRKMPAVRPGMTFIFDFAEFIPFREKLWNIRPIALAIKADEYGDWIPGCYETTPETLFVEGDPKLKVWKNRFPGSACLWVSGDWDVLLIAYLDHQDELTEWLDYYDQEQQQFATADLIQVSRFVASQTFFKAMTSNFKLEEYYGKRDKKTPRWAYSDVYHVNQFLINMHAIKWTAKKLVLWATLMGNDFLWPKDPTNKNPNKQELLPDIGGTHIRDGLLEHGHTMLQSTDTFRAAIEYIRRIKFGFNQYTRAGAEILMKNDKLEQYRRLCRSMIRYWRAQNEHGFDPKERMLIS
jgi:hypothetical protein